MVERKGRQCETRSCSRPLGACSKVFPGHGKHPPTVAEEEIIGSEYQQSRRSSPFSRYQLIVHVVRAVCLPRGLVLWPDSPCLRLSTVIDGRKSDTSEEVLHINEGMPSASMTGEAKGEGAEEESIEAKGEEVEVLSGTKAHVLVLQSTLPDVSLQLEVVVGRVVTAKVDIDLTGIMTASLDLKSETSSGIHTTVKLPNGGEVTLTLNMSRVIPSAVDETARVMNEGDVKSPRLPRDVVDTENERIEVFLRSIASWGHEDYTTTMLDRDNRGYSSIDNTNVQPGSIGEGLESGADRYKSAFPDLSGWLASSHPDPIFLRTALEKTGNYSFPKVEAPFLAALLKHGGLVGEALRAVETRVTAREQGDGAHAMQGGIECRSLPCFLWYIITSLGATTSDATFLCLI